MSRLSDIAERAAEGAGADTLISARRERTIRWEAAPGARAACRATEVTVVDVTCVREGRAGHARATATDEDSLDRVVAAAAAAAEDLARALGPGPHPGFPDPTAARPHEGYDPATARLELPDLSPLGEGVYGARALEVALASGRGLRAQERVTVAELELVRGRVRSRAAAPAARELDLARLAQRAEALQPAAGTPPGALASGDHRAVLRPAAVAAVLEVLGRTGFNGRLHAEGRGALAGRLGRRAAAPSINLSDSPRFPSTLPRSYDDEGVPKAPIPLIQDGVAHRVVHDLTSAAAVGPAAASTGHATGGPAGPSPRNLVLVGGGVADEEGLAEPVERGVLVAGLHDVRISDEDSAGFTARLAPGSALIEDGRVVAPLDGLSVTDSALGLLGAVEALAASPELVLAARNGLACYPHGTVCPALRVARLALRAS